MMKEEPERETLPHRLYRYAITGETQDEKPFQLVYCTTEVDTFHDVQKCLNEEGVALHDIKSIEALIQNRFPSFTLLTIEIGEDINRINHLPPLHLGTKQDIQARHTPKLLKAALMEKRAAAEDSIRRAGNEFFSNLPTFYAMATKGEAGYLVAGLCGLCIVGMISYRGHSQNEDFERVLKIWAAYEKNKTANNPDTFADLAQAMEEEALLFSGVSVDADLRHFKPTAFKTLAKEKGLWDDIPQADASRKEKLVRIFHTVNNCPAPVAKFLREQTEDLFTTLFKASTYKNIGKGLSALPQLARHFVTAAGHQKPHPQKRHLASAAPEKEKKPKDIHIEQLDFVDDTIDPHLEKSLDTAYKDRARARKDGLIMGTAHTAETLFTIEHAAKVQSACCDLLNENTLLSFWNAPTETPLPLTDDGTSLVLSTYSIGMTMGAWSYIGQELSHINNTLKSRQAHIVQLYDDLKNQMATPHTPDV